MWTKLTTVLTAGILAVAIIVSWTALILGGYADQVPSAYESLLPALATGGILGAAFAQSKDG